MNYTAIPLPIWQTARRPLGAFFFAFLLASSLAVLALMGCQGCNTPAPQAVEAGTYVLAVERCIQRYRPDQCEERLACKQGVEISYGFDAGGSCAPIEAIDAGDRK